MNFRTLKFGAVETLDFLESESTLRGKQPAQSAQENALFTRGLGLKATLEKRHILLTQFLQNPARQVW